MILPKFDYVAPTSLAEALEYLARRRGEAVKVLAGGTDLLVDIRGKVIPDGHRPRCQAHRQAAKWQARHNPVPAVKCLVSLSRIPELRGITVEGRRVHIGAMTTIMELERSPLVTRLLPPLGDGAKALGSPLVRFRGTYGGNLCNARPAADTAIPTLALGGRLQLASVRGTRTVDHRDFVLAPGKTILEPDEVLTEIEFALPEGPAAGCYLKLANRKALEISVVGAAVWVEFEGVSTGDGMGVVRQARVALGAVAPTPLRVETAEEALTGRPLTEPNIRKAAAAAAEGCKPITDHRGGAEYRRLMVEVLVRRALGICAERARRAQAEATA